MGITFGIHDDGLSDTFGGGVTKVKAYLGGRRTELRKYGISNGCPSDSFFAKRAHTQGETAQQKRWHATCSTNLGVNFWILV
jgi:hypothetical protein